MHNSRAERPIHIERPAERALEPTQRELRRQRENGAREPARKLTAHVAAPRERACVPLDSHRLRAESEGAGLAPRFGEQAFARRSR